MTLPYVEWLMRPLLKLAVDGDEHSTSEATDRLADQFGLTAEERAEKLWHPLIKSMPRRFDSRVARAMEELEGACLLERTGPDKFRITERGAQLLADTPAPLTLKYLCRFPEYREFRANQFPKPPEIIEWERLKELYMGVLGKRPKPAGLTAAESAAWDRMAKEVAEAGPNTYWRIPS